MTAKELISALSELPPDVKVMIWIDGDRHEISQSTPVDAWGDFHADINAIAQPEKEQSK